MKKIFTLLLISVLFISSCQKDEEDNTGPFQYKVIITRNEIPVPGATLMYIFSETEEKIIKCDDNGVAMITSDKPIKLAVGMSSGVSGLKQGLIENNKENEIILQDVDLSYPPLKSAEYVGTFGVYSTDGAGDVKFRYQGTFINFYCSSYLPWLLTTNDPNGWTSWDLTDFLPWNGKKLLVPTRYQEYHQTVYGFSISSALFLTANL